MEDSWASDWANLLESYQYMRKGTLYVLVGNAVGVIALLSALATGIPLSEGGFAILIIGAEFPL